MRCRASSGFLTAALLVVAGCDTDQPLQLTGRQVQVDFIATLEAPLVVEYDIWNLFEDSNNDSNPDDVSGDGIPDVTLWCSETSRGATDVPWLYTLAIERIRAGQTTAELLTSSGAKNPGPNQTPYDPTPPITGVSPALATVTLDVQRGRCSLNKGIKCDPSGGGLTAAGVCGLGSCVRVCTGNNITTCTSDLNCVAQGLGTCGTPETRTFIFDNATSRRAFASNEVFKGAAPRNHLSDICNVGTCSGVDFQPGICPSHNLGEARIDGSPPPFELFVDAGDTLIVTARRVDTVPQAAGFARVDSQLVPINPLFALPPGSVPNAALPLLRATLTVEGVPVQADQIDGETLIPSGNQNTAISFVYQAD